MIAETTDEKEDTRECVINLLSVVEKYLQLGEMTQNQALDNSRTSNLEDMGRFGGILIEEDEHKKLNEALTTLTADLETST